MKLCVECAREHIHTSKNTKEIKDNKTGIDNIVVEIKSKDLKIIELDQKIR